MIFRSKTTPQPALTLFTLLNLVAFLDKRHKINYFGITCPHFFQGLLRLGRRGRERSRRRGWGRRRSGRWSRRLGRSRGDFRLVFLSVQAIVD